MEYSDFIEQVKKIFPDMDQQRAFCEKIIKEETEKSKVKFSAFFYYAVTFYYDGNFEKARKSIEPYVMDYQSYEYSHEIISAFNLMGLVAHYNREYILSRYYYMMALKIAKLRNDTSRYTSEYNNITLTYIAQKQFDLALENGLLAKKYLSESDADIGAHIYLNLSEIYLNLNAYEKALKAYNTGFITCNGKNILAQDYLTFGLKLFFQLENQEKYKEYQQNIMDSIDSFTAAEFIDACHSMFYCSMQRKNYEHALLVISQMEVYFDAHPDETSLALMLEDYKYEYAKALNDVEGMFQALKTKNLYYEQIIEESQSRRVQELDTYFHVNKELYDAKEQAPKANHVKTQFLSNMSHDMRTPINGIMGMTQMIYKYRDDDIKVNDCLSKIDASSQHLLSLVNDVLDMNKLETDNVDIEYEPFNLDEVCKQVDEIVRPQAEKELLQVYQTHVDVTNVYLMGSATSLKKILLNLFTNSIKYNKPNGCIYTSLKEISRNLKSVTYEFKIWDTGIGMSKEFMATKLYDPFVQGGNAARSKYGGTGLGMSIVKGLVEKMHGSISVESQLGKGSCFTVVLTFDLDTKTKQAKKIKLNQENLKNKHILVVEDNALNMEVARFFLEDLNVKVSMAKNGKEAIQMVQKEKYDLILMDLMMPVMDGFETTKIIRKFNSKVPIVALSANAYNEDVQKCMDVGMNAHISKPLTEENLSSAILKFVE